MKILYHRSYIDFFHFPSQDQDDQLLEEERDKVLTGFVVMIQKRVRGWFLRRRFLALRKASLVFQKNFRRHAAQRRWRIVSSKTIHPNLKCKKATIIAQSWHLYHDLTTKLFLQAMPHKINILSKIQQNHEIFTNYNYLSIVLAMYTRF